MFNNWVSVLASVTTTIFVVAVLFRYWHGQRPYMLIWGIGLILFAIGTWTESYYAFLGWNDLVYRLWYLAGAILVAAWLGQGTVYLLFKRTWANALLLILTIASIYAAYRVFSAQLDPSLMAHGELSGKAIITPGVRVLSPFFNIYGTLMLVGGAIYSAWIFWRKRILLHRVVGNILIAAGALFPAFGGALQRIGVPYALYSTELLGVILIFIGFLRATHGDVGTKA